MKIFLILSLALIAILLIGKNFYHLAKRNLFKDQAAWSGKDIKIKYINQRDGKSSKSNNNLLKVIAAESKIYLDSESKEKEEE